MMFYREDHLAFDARALRAGNHVHVREIGDHETKIGLRPIGPEIRKVHSPFSNDVYVARHASHGVITGGQNQVIDLVSVVTDHDGVTFEALDVLAMRVGVVGVFSDWPATVTYYANCMGLD